MREDNSFGDWVVMILLIALLVGILSRLGNLDESEKPNTYQQFKWDLLFK